MAYPFSLPQNFKVVLGLAPTVGAAGALPSVPITCKYAHKVWIVVNISDVDGDALLLTPERIDGVGGTPAALAGTVPIWSNAAIAVNDTLVRSTAANFTTDATVSGKQVIFEIDPDALGVTPGGVPYTAVRLNTAAVNANTRISIEYIVAMRYEQATPPTLLVD